MSRLRGGGRATRGEEVWDRLALVLFFLGALLRGLYLLQAVDRSPVLDDPLADSRAIVDLARSVASGNLQQAEPFYRAPLVPYLMAPLYALLDHPVVVIVLLQAAGGLAAGAVLWSLSRSLHGAAAAFVTLLLWSLFGPVASHETKILSTPAAILLAVLAMQGLARARTPGAWGAGGALIGLGALAQPSLLIAAPLVAATIVLDRDEGTRPWRSQLLPLLIGLLVAVAPTTIHNIRAGDRVAISSNGGMTFYHGNNESSRWGLLEPSARVGWGGNAIRQGEIDRAAASREVGKDLRPSESSAYWFFQGMRALASNPANWAKLWGTKLLRFVGAHDYADNYSYSVEKVAVPLLRFLVVPFPIILLLAVAGLVLSPPRARSDRVIVSFALVGLVTCVTFFVGSRYRCLSVPALAVLAGRAVAVWEGAGRRRRRAAGAVALVVMAAAFYPPGEGASGQDSMAAAQWAAALERTGRPGAEKFYERATDWDPSNAVAWGRRAHLAEGRGGPAPAIAILSQGIVRGADGRLLRLERGTARTRAGDWGGAAEDFRTALAHAPDDPAAAYLLGTALIRLGRDPEAFDVLGLPQLARDRKALGERGKAALRLGDPRSAAALFDTLLALGPENETVAILRAAAWARAGDAGRAREWLTGWIATQTACDPGEWTEKLLKLLAAAPPAGPILFTGFEPDCETRVTGALSTIGGAP